MSRKSDTADGGRSDSYRPAGRLTRRRPQSSREVASAARATTSTSVKSTVERPVHAELSRSGVLTFSSIEPVGCTHRLRTPVDVPSQTVLTSWEAKP
jgi:hypothetical protein